MKPAQNKDVVEVDAEVGVVRGALGSTIKMYIKMMHKLSVLKMDVAPAPL